MTEGHPRAKIWTLKKKLSHYELADIINRFTSKINYSMRICFREDQHLMGRILTRDGRKILTPEDINNMMDDLYNAAKDLITYKDLLKLLEDNYKSFKMVYEKLPDSNKKFEILARFLFISMLILATDFSRYPRFGVALIFREVRDLRNMIKNYKEAFF